MQDEFIYNTPQDESAEIEAKIRRIVKDLNYKEMVELIGLEIAEELCVDILCENWKDLKYEYDPDLR